MPHVLLEDKVHQLTMLVTRTARRIVQFMLITLVINMGGWTFNEDAVADVWFDEQGSLVAEAEHTSTGHEAPQTVSHQHTCNHWCHEVGHFVGLLGQPASVTPEFSNEYTTQPSFIVQLPSPDGLFRPPRRIS